MTDEIGITKRHEGGVLVNNKFFVKLRTFFDSKYYLMCLFIFSTLMYAFKLEVVAVVTLLFIFAFCMIFFEDILSTVYPVFLCFVIVMRMHTTKQIFLDVWYLALVPILALFFHLLYYRPKQAIKLRLFFPYLAISIALILGGIFSISAKDYFRGTALYYMLGSGLAMLVAYVIISYYLNPRREYSTKDKLSQLFNWTGAFTVLCLVIQYITDVFPLLASLGDVVPSQPLTDMIIGDALQLGNNFATILIICVPFAFYYATTAKRHNGYYFALGIFECAAMVFSMSRAGFILGLGSLIPSIICCFILAKKDKRTLLSLLTGLCYSLTVILIIVLCFLPRWNFLFQLAFCFYRMSTKALLFFIAAPLLVSLLTVALILSYLAPDKIRRRLFVTYGVILGLGVICIFVFWQQFYPLMLSVDHYRAEMGNIAINNFEKFPIFGTGVGYTGLSHIYNPKPGMFACYHCCIFQIIGSMGLVGVIAYAYALISKVKLLLAVEKKSNVWIFFSILGLLLMSLINPGIFVPLPYATFMVFLCCMCETELKNEPLAIDYDATS